jgi:hypothetical protein
MIIKTGLLNGMGIYALRNYAEYETFLWSLNNELLDITSFFCLFSF